MADMRTCIGSATFGIEAHEAPVDDFPAQPSQKDGLGRMCKPHWTEYTRALRKAALASKVAVKLPVGTMPPVGTGTPPVVHVSNQQRRAAAQAAGKVPAADGTVPKARRARGAPEPIRTRPARGRKTEGEQIVEAVDAAIAEASIA